MKSCKLVCNGYQTLDIPFVIIHLLWTIALNNAVNFLKHLQVYCVYCAQVNVTYLDPHYYGPMMQEIHVMEDKTSTQKARQTWYRDSTLNVDIIWININWTLLYTKHHKSALMTHSFSEPSTLLWSIHHRWVNTMVYGRG